MRKEFRVICTLLIFVSVVALTGCGGSSGTSVGVEELTGTVTNRSISFDPTVPEADEVPITNETVTLVSDDGDNVVVTTDDQGRFRLRLRKRDGSCSLNGEIENGGKRHRYGGNGEFGAGKRIRWNFVDNDGDGICDNTLEVLLQ